MNRIDVALRMQGKERYFSAHACMYALHNELLGMILDFLSFYVSHKWQLKFSLFATHSFISNGFSGCFSLHLLYILLKCFSSTVFWFLCAAEIT